MNLHLVPSEDQVLDFAATALGGAAARVAASVESGRSCRHLGRAMMARMSEAIDLYEAGVFSLAQAERAVEESENLAVALAPQHRA